MVGKFLTASAGILSVQGVDALPTNGADMGEIVKIAIQLVIGLVSLFTMLRKPKPQIISNQNSNF